jgi:hypothetical protein
MALAAAAIVLAVASALALALTQPAPAPHATSARRGHHRASSAHGRSPNPPEASTRPPHAERSATSPTAGVTRSSLGSTSPTTQPTTTGGPRLSSVTPDSGGPGETVVVDGSGLFSANGQVVAYFGGQAAPTSCVSQTSCTVTIPDLGASPSTVPLTMTTDQGRSNALTFTYH